MQSGIQNTTDADSGIHGRRADNPLLSNSLPHVGASDLPVSEDIAESTPVEAVASAGELLNSVRSRLGHILEERALEQQSLLSLVGVTSRSLDRYQANLLIELERIQKFEARIMKRSLREQVGQVAATLAAISLNIEQDPNDIREEIGLTTVLKQLANGLEEYVSIVAKRNRHPEVLERMSAVEQSVADAIPWLDELLERMKSNDGEHALARARVVSRIFRDTTPRQGQSVD